MRAQEVPFNYFIYISDLRECQSTQYIFSSKDSVTTQKPQSELIKGTLYYIRVNIRELNRELCIESSTLYTKI